MIKNFSKFLLGLILFNSIFCSALLPAKAGFTPSNAFLKQTGQLASADHVNLSDDGNPVPATDAIPSMDSVEPMRGIYVATVLNLDYPQTPTTDSQVLQSEIDDIINTCDELGFNSIFLQVRPCADALYPSAVYPWSKYLTGTQDVAPDNQFDPLAYWVEQSHAHNLALHAWVNPYRITKKASDWNAISARNPAKLHPEWVIHHTNGNYYFDPAIPEVRELVVTGIMEILTNYDVDGIHLDDYFYPGIDFPDDASFVKYNADNYLDKNNWRRHNVDLLIQELDTQIHNYKPDCSFGISPSGVWENASANPLGSNTRGGNPSYSKQFADTRTWALNGWVDYIAPQIYWENGNRFCDYATLLDWWSTTLASCDTKLYIAMADYRANEVSGSSPWFHGAELSKQMGQNLMQENVGGEIHFRYRSVASNPNLQQAIKSFYKTPQV